MNRRIDFVWLCVAVTGAVNFATNFARADEPTFVAPSIQVPPGFTVEVAAAPPLVRHPLMANFDERGRLFIAESAGENLRREELEARLPNFIRMLEDTDGDGRFDRSTIFADQMTLPQGALWHDGALYVAAPPCIWRLEDTDDDGVADRREKLVDQFGYTGNAASVHGCFLGPEGRIYWCDGRHGHEFRNERGEIVSQGKAARIFSCRPDGSDIQVHCGGGMDNPVEIDFLSTGEMLGTVNLFYRKRGDCLVNWARGGVYPRYDQPQCIAEFPSTGDLLGPVHDYGHVAVSGMMRYRGDAWGDGFRDNLFVTHFNTHQVARTRLAREGSTFRVASTETFLQADSIDFHPTDVLQDADGSLLVIDTGGWFRIGCPTSQIAKPNILGAIYRIRRAAAAPVSDPRGQQLAWSNASAPELAERLGDVRPAVRERAIQTLAKRGASAVSVLAAIVRDSSQPTSTRVNALWALTRMQDDEANRVLRSALKSSESEMRQVAAFGLGANGDSQAAEKLVNLLIDAAPQVRRAAATSLGQIGDGIAVDGLLAALAEPSDPVLEHSLIYALIEIGDAAATRAGLTNENPRVRRGALLALDAMQPNPLRPEDVAELLRTGEPTLRTAALQVIAKHVDWSTAAGEAITRMLDSPKTSDADRALLIELLVAFRDAEEVRRLVAERLTSAATTEATAGALLEAMARMDLATAPDAWQAPLERRLLASADETTARAIEAANNLGAESFAEPLTRIANDRSRSDELRLAALTAVAFGRPISDAQFAWLAGQLTAAETPSQRWTAARTIAAARLSPQQLQRAFELLAEAGPLEMSALVDVAAQVQDEATGKQFIASAAKAAERVSVPPGAINDLLKRFPSLASRLPERLSSGATSGDVAEQAA
ncbi:MAG: HEAT repeat domain-containing protein, partial [Planctomycetales bacterium]|nr:HEAT repeat domain-containing protein [Planctomycetales bacterium]